MVETAESVHERAWRSILGGAAQDGFDRYAIYASRTLAVKHPEVHLKADSRFVDHITTNNGYSNAYAVKDVHSREFLTDMQFRKYPPFKFDAVDFDSLITLKFGDLYPDGYPFFPYLDRRMLPVASTLKTREDRVTELEKVALLYQKERVNLGGCSELLVIYCENERSYLYESGKVMDAGFREVESIEGEPILIFNEGYAWYPLMDRDDTTESTALKSVVETFAPDPRTPEFNDVEKEFLEILKEVTCLGDDRQKGMAILSSCRSTGRQTCQAPLSDYRPFHALWDEVLPAKRVRAWQYYGYIEQILIRGDKLSPITAYLASLSLGAVGFDGLVAIEEEWLGRVALPGYNYVWGHLWDECLVEYSVDESFRTSAGHCMVQAMIISAVLDLVGIDNYMMEGEVPGSHHFVLIPEYEFTFDNARLRSNRRQVMLDLPRGNKVLARFHHNGKFCSPIAGGHYSGTWSPDEAVEELDHLAGLWGNEILIYANGDHETRPTVLNRNNRAMTNDYKLLLQEDWEDLKLP